jgi:hypothetical protein
LAALGYYATGGGRGGRFASLNALTGSGGLAMLRTKSKRWPMKTETLIAGAAFWQCGSRLLRFSVDMPARRTGGVVIPSLGEFDWAAGYVEVVIDGARGFVDPLALVAAEVAAESNEDEDICGLCGKPGADKYAHPVRWPGELEPSEPLVHSSCEAIECQRAMLELTDVQREIFLRTI